MLSKRIFDYTKDGRTVNCYKIKNETGAYVEILDYGGIIRALCVQNSKGDLTDVVIGFDRLTPYIKNSDAYFGAFVGRFANRIKDAKFTFDGAEYQLEKNDGQNCLHGGSGSYSERLAEVVEETDDSVTMRWDSPDMDNGFPGHLVVTVKYSFDDDNRLTITYNGKTDKDTLFNPTNHSYFNMDSPSRSYIGDNEIKISADKFIPVDDECIPSGEPQTVKGALDMRRWTKIASALKKDDTDPNLIAGNGIDHNFLIRNYDGRKILPAAQLYGPGTGIRMTVSTDLPGLQVYSGNYIPDNLKGKMGRVYGRRCAVCFETQFYPDSPNHPDWPSPVLKAGEEVEYTTRYDFDVPPKGVILDGFTTVRNDLSWAPVEEVCRIDAYDRTQPKDILKRCRDCEIVFTNKAVLTKEIIESLPDLKYVGLLSTGANAVDIDAIRENGIALTNIPGYSTEDVAQLTFALILELCQKTALHADAVRDGEWVDSDDFCFTKAPLIELAGKTIGIVGYGEIGSRVCEIARAFRMKVLVNSRTKKELPEGVRFVTLNELLRRSDIVTLHCPLTADTREMIDSHALSLMRPGAILINTARGPLLNEEDVAAALNAGEIAGLGADVLSTEPPEASNPLLSAKNTVITPHIAWAAQAARARLIEAAAKNVNAFINGRRLNRLD